MATRRRGLLIAVAEVEVSANNSSKDGPVSCKEGLLYECTHCGTSQTLVLAGHYKSDAYMHNLDLVSHTCNQARYAGLNTDAM